MGNVNNHKYFQLISPFIYKKINIKMRPNNMF